MTFQAFWEDKCQNIQDVKVFSYQELKVKVLSERDF